MKAVFLDRDGVINENRPDHVKSWAEFRFLPGIAESIIQLNRAKYLVFVVTNQAVINRGRLSHQEVEEINSRMVQELAKKGGEITEVLCCPHRPDENCQCRKPNPGLIYRAAATHSLDLQYSYLVGDAVTDIAAGLAAGCESILVLTGRGWKQFLSREARRYHGYRVARNLEQAVGLIVREENQRKAAPYSRPTVAHIDYQNLTGSEPVAYSSRAMAAIVGEPSLTPGAYALKRRVEELGGRLAWQDLTVIDELWQESWARAARCSFKVVSGSMRPLIESGDRVMVRQADSRSVRIGDIAAFRVGDHVLVHRVIGARRQNKELHFRQRGDATRGAELIPAVQLLGKVVSIEKGETTIDLESPTSRLRSRLKGFYFCLNDALYRGRGRWVIEAGGRIKRYLKSRLPARNGQ